MGFPNHRIVDAHAHMCDPVFDTDRADVIRRARAAGVVAIIAVSENLSDAKRNIELAANRIPKKFGFDAINDIQVLSPMHKGLVGTANLNKELQKHLNPQKDNIVYGNTTFHSQDKVMQIRNNYDKNVYNGDIGRVLDINRETREVMVEFDGRKIPYDFTELDEVVPAYAVSIHKSQGSEYPAVIIPVLTQHYILLQRNLIYTAVTRGRQLVILVGTKKAMAIAINNDKTQQRFTRLKDRLQGKTYFRIID